MGDREQCVGRYLGLTSVLLMDQGADEQMLLVFVTNENSFIPSLCIIVRFLDDHTQSLANKINNLRGDQTQVQCSGVSEWIRDIIRLT
jgi:hypothetical protein